MWDTRLSAHQRWARHASHHRGVFSSTFPKHHPCFASSVQCWAVGHMSYFCRLVTASCCFTDVSRVGLTVSFFFLVSRNTKLYETGHYFAEFRSFRETKKNYENTKKSVSSCFAKLKKPFRFVVTV